MYSLRWKTRGNPEVIYFNKKRDLSLNTGRGGGCYKTVGVYVCGGGGQVRFYPYIYKKGRGELVLAMLKGDTV